MTERSLALVTGASSGIGADLARCFAQAGHPLVLTARRKDRLEALVQELRAAYGIEVFCHAADLEQEGAPERLISHLAGKGLNVGILVNNAGYGKIGVFKDQSLEDLSGIVRLNVQALTTLSRLVLPGMMARREGGILNIASMAAFFPGPGFAAYYASKAYVLSLSESLHEEARPHGVTVSAFCPGPVETEFWSRAGEKPPFMKSLTSSLSSERAARMAYEGFCKGRAVIVPTWSNCLAVAASSLLPRLVRRRMMAAMQMR